MDKISVGIGEGKTAVNQQILISYALGSCVGVCMYDRDKKIAGMAHIVLPGKESAVSRENPYKFADEGVKELIREMERAGASRKRITAKIAGGAGNRGAECCGCEACPGKGRHKARGRKYGEKLWQDDFVLRRGR